MNKKAQGYFLVIFMAVLGIVLVSSLLIPTVKTSTSSQEDSLNLVVTSGENITQTLDKASDGLTLESGTLSVTGLTLTTNYTVNYNTGVVSFVNGTIAGTYPATYNYYEAQYIESSAERSLMAVIILLGIIGLILVIGKGFGIV